MEGAEAPETPDLEYFLGAGGGSAGGAGDGDAPAAGSGAYGGAGSDKGDASAAPQEAQQGGSGSAGASGASGGAAGSRKRPLDDKKARDKKRILRNRELARVSNERRKGRIKAMENELDETRKTVSSLEESIRSLEAENNELKSLLANKS